MRQDGQAVFSTRSTSNTPPQATNNALAAEKERMDVLLARQYNLITALMDSGNMGLAGDKGGTIQEKTLGEGGRAGLCPMRKRGWPPACNMQRQDTQTCAATAPLAKSRSVASASDAKVSAPTPCSPSAY